MSIPVWAWVLYLFLFFGTIVVAARNPDNRR